jgi:ABC-type sulfate/molybdate transport systems ATPase subunit
MKIRIEQEGSPAKVYNHLATAFVYNLLANVNWFHGRVDGKVCIDERETGDVFYVRLHLLDIDRLSNRGDHFRARIRYFNSAGPLVKVEATTDWGALVAVDIPQERFRNLQLVNHEAGFLMPKDVKVFPASNTPAGRQKEAC